MDSWGAAKRASDSQAARPLDSRARGETRKNPGDWKAQKIPRRTQENTAWDFGKNTCIKWTIMVSFAYTVVGPYGVPYEYRCDEREKYPRNPATERTRRRLKTRPAESVWEVHPSALHPNGFFSVGECVSPALRAFE